MLSISARGSAASATRYYAHLAADAQPDAQPDDYYAREGAGQWLGAGADALGLTDKVSASQFQRVLEGRTPADGKDLVQGAGEKHRAGWDLTFSAPKSVSVIWGTSADTELRSAISVAHDHAVKAALNQLQHDAEAIVARRGKGGLVQEKADMVVATFQHGTSRELDPQLHTHAFVANLAQRSDGTWGAIEPRAMYQWKMTAGAVYRAELAHSLAEQGLSIEADGDSFKLAGVSEEVCHRFSKRREQIEQALTEHRASGAKASEVAALDTRKAKASDLDHDQLHERWMAEAKTLGFSADQVQVLTAREPEPLPTVTELLRRATEHDAVIDARQVWQAVAVACQHRALGLDHIRQQVEQVMQSPEIIRLIHPETGEVKYTTKELYQQERAVLSYARGHAGDKHHVVGSAKVDAALAQFAKDKGFALSNEQQAAVRHVAQGAGAVRVIVGDAGTGKSTAMLAARMAWEANGQRVIGCAISGKAAAGLQEGSGIESRTITSLLMSLEPSTDPETGAVKQPREKLTNRDVIVVDEAGMVDSRIMYRMIDHAEKAGARVILVGDHKQLQAVGAGGVFRHLAEQDSAQITEIRRQKSEWARTAVQEFSRGEAAEALGKFIDRGLVHVADDGQSGIQRAVERWQHHVTEVGVTETLLMASTNAEVAELNRAARTAMADRLGHEVTIWTTDRNGKPAGRLAVAEGDRLLTRKNDKTTGLKNGDLMTVRGIRYTQDGVLITARIDRTGETVTFDPTEYSQLRHGYAVTTYAAQGATVDRAVVLGGGSMTSREATYVQMSRMRDTAEIVITKQQIENAVDQAPPIENMVELCQSLSASKGLELPEDYMDSFTSARGWLNDHSDQRVEGGKQEGAALLANLKDAVAAMGRSRRKETTLDYEAEPAPGNNKRTLQLELRR
jgi:Ti-type conjugative transfer relaxase TraA